MSSISFPFDLTDATLSSGTTGTYTCPPNKKAIISIILSNTTVRSTSGNPNGAISKTRTFIDFASAGDVFTLTASGEGNFLSGTISASYLKNSVTQQTVTNTFPSLSSTSYFYTSEASYSVIEFNL